jgi:hypothetical protein
VPLDDSTRSQLEVNDVYSEAGVRHLPLDDDQVFYRLLRGGVLEKVNRRLGSLIDEYEDESIQPDKHTAVLEMLDEAIGDSSTDKKVREVLVAMTSLFREAKAREMPVFFVL